MPVDIPRSLQVWDIPMELLPDALSIFSLIFLAFKYVLARPVTHLFSWNGLANKVILQLPNLVSRRTLYLTDIEGCKLAKSVRQQFLMLWKQWPTVFFQEWKFA